MNRVELLTHLARRMNDHSDLPAEPESVTDDHRAALLAVWDAARSGTPDQLSEALTECAQVHERHSLSGADWMREAAQSADHLMA